VFYDPSRGVYRGRDEIDRVAGAITSKVSLGELARIS
jgi:hypothetical protein